MCTGNASDYCDVFLADHLRESINPVYTKSVIDRIREMDLSDNRYLYSYGEYVGEKELETAEYFRNLSEEALWKIADTYTRRYRKEDCQAEKSVVQIFIVRDLSGLILAVLADLEKTGNRTCHLHSGIRCDCKRRTAWECKSAV